MGLIFTAAVYLAADLSDTVYCSDASMAGHALRLTRVPPADLRPLAELRERCFRPVEFRPLSFVPPTFTPGLEASWRPPLGLSPPGPLSSHPGFDFCAPPVGAPRAGRIFDFFECLERVQPLPDAFFEPQRWSLIVDGA
jgi:hypothetical protein